MKRRCHQLVALVGVALGIGSAAAGEPATIPAHRIDGRSYVTVGDLAAYYHLGRGIRDDGKRIEYRTGAAQMVLETDRRELLLDGVGHWLSTPVLFARGEFWVTPLDILKTIDPVLRHRPTTAGTGSWTVVLDPGHGGRDEGTRGAHSREKDLTLELAKRVAQDLGAAGGFRVVLTRTSDLTVSLEQRADFCRSAHADLYVSLHFNAGGTADGIETYCVPPAGAPTTARAPYEGETEATGANAAVTNNHFDDRNVWLAHCVQKSLLEATQANDRGVRRARFYVLRYATCPAILVEGGFLSNRAEEQRILTKEYQAELARAVAGGIAAYAGRPAGEHLP